MLGTVIQAKRKELGITQEQLADMLNVTAPAVNKWEKNISCPDAELLAPLARILRTDLNELFSFYEVLSERDRKVITSQLRKKSLFEDLESVLAYIEEISF